MDKIQDLELRQNLQDTWIKVSSLPLIEDREHFIRHLRRGLGRRLGFIGRNYQFLIDELGKNGDTPLRGTFCSDIQIHLNSFYVHLRGSLDNLAWLYIFKKFPQASEDTPQYRKYADLFRADFLRLIKDDYPKIHKTVSGRTDWHDRLKSLRDPIAHRVPIYSPPAFWTKEDQTNFDKLSSEKSDALRIFNFESSDNIQKEIQCIGKYKPYISNEVSGSIDCMGMFDTLYEDLKILIEITEAFIPIYLKNVA